MIFNKKTKKITFTLIAFLIISLIFSLNANANQNTSNNDFSNNDALEKLKQHFPANDITITNIDDLYQTLDSISFITDDILYDSLSKCSDEVLKIYLYNEIQKANTCFEELTESPNKPINNDNLFRNHTAQYYKDENSESYKTELKVESNYNSTFKITTSNLSITNKRNNFTNWKQIAYKNDKNKLVPYGPYKYNATRGIQIGSVEICSCTLTLNYTVSDNGLVGTNLKSNIQPFPLPGILSITSSEPDLEDSKATHVDANINGYVIYTATATPALFGGIIVQENRDEMFIKIIGWSKEAKNMIVQPSFKSSVRNISE